MVQHFDLRESQDQIQLEQIPFHKWESPDGSIWTEFYRLDGAYLLRFPGLADFAISSDALEVACNPVSGVSTHTTEHLFLSQVWPLVLNRRGALVFHASAIEVDGGAIAFVGESGKGKSTLAASFALSGCPFLTDDGLVIECNEDGLQAFPSHPSIRLWTDSEQALIDPKVRRAPALNYTSKAKLLADSDLVFCKTSRELRQAYFLGKASERFVEFHAMSPSEALIEWTKHSFLMDIEDRSTLELHFEQLARLSNQRIHYRIDYPRNYDELPRVRECIIEHINASKGNL